MFVLVQTIKVDLSREAAMKKFIRKLLRHTVTRLMGGSLSDLKQQNINLLKTQDPCYRDLVDLVPGAKLAHHNRNIKLVMST